MSVTTNLQLMTALTDAIKRYGIAVVSVGFLAFYFWVELKDVKLESRNCSRELIEMYRNDRLEMLKVIERNTEALQTIKGN